MRHSSVRRLVHVPPRHPRSEQQLHHLAHSPRRREIGRQAAARREPGAHGLAFAGADPVNGFDPTGQCPSCAVGAIAGGFLGAGSYLFGTLSDGRSPTAAGLVGAGLVGASLGAMLPVTAGAKGLSVGAAVALQSVRTILYGGVALITQVALKRASPARNQEPGSGGRSSRDQRAGGARGSTSSGQGGGFGDGFRTGGGSYQNCGWQTFGFSGQNGTDGEAWSITVTVNTCTGAMDIDRSPNTPPGIVIGPNNN